MKKNGSSKFDVPIAPMCETFLYRVFKRSIDIFVSIIALILLSPLMGLIALGIKFSSQGPVFFRWDVVGKGGKPFTGYKFRTMVEEAHKLRRKLEKFNERKGPIFKMEKDPRVTPLGRILRKFSLDELPQLWSVIRGDMSLVGPRPVGPDEWKKFKSWQRRKLSVVPGCISPWHVWGKNKEFKEWLRCELHYIDHWSLWTDIKILVGGIWYILRGKNY